MLFIELNIKHVSLRKEWYQSSNICLFARRFNVLFSKELWYKKKMYAECLNPPALWLVWITLYSFFPSDIIACFEVEGMFTLWILWQSHTHTESSQLGGRKCFFFIYSFFISSNEPFVDINPSMFFMIMWALSFFICFYDFFYSSSYLFSACHVMDIHSSNLSCSHGLMEI